MIQECVVDRDCVSGIREGGKSGGLSWGDKLLGHPDFVWGGLCKEVGPVGGFSPFDGFEVAEVGLSCCGVGVGCPELFSPAGSFCEFLSLGGEEWGPPSFSLGEGRERGVLSSIVVVSAERAEENHWWSWLGRELRGGEGSASS